MTDVRKNQRELTSASNRARDFASRVTRVCNLLVTYIVTREHREEAHLLAPIGSLLIIFGERGIKYDTCDTPE